MIDAPHLSAEERDARANARDFQFDADTLRQQAQRARGDRKRALLATATAWEFKSAGWLAKAEGRP